MLRGFINNRLAISSPPSLHCPNRRVIEFSFPFGEPNLKRSMRRGTKTLLFFISSKPSWQPKSKASTAKASSVMPALSSINRSMSNGTAPATTALALFTS
ncbi:hypothetical protein CsSME_00001055 [Camellia sinensis var. sinensis]